MSHSVKIYDTCIGCTQCVWACPTDVLEMIPWDGCKAKQIASAPRTEDCVGCKRCPKKIHSIWYRKRVHNKLWILTIITSLCRDIHVSFFDNVMDG